MDGPTALVLKACEELGFDDAGVASASAPLFGAEEVPAAREEGRLAALDYLERSASARTDIDALLPGAKSVVVVVQNYYAGDHEEHVDQAALDEGARVSRYAWGSDYHNVLRKKVRKLRKRLLRTFVDAGEVRFAPFLDTAPVLERAWAQAAGLGFVGKSGLFIHRRFGTWTFLGGLATDLELEPTGEGFAGGRQDHCGTCRRCLEACPTDAFVGPWQLDVGRCLTTWNVERPLEEGPDLGAHDWAAGCDVCQEVCPWNRFATLTADERFFPREGHVVMTEESVPDEEGLVGTPLARAGRAGLARAIARARRR